MSCTSPSQCWKINITVSGQPAKPVFQMPHQSQLHLYTPMRVPCNRCIDCKLAHASQMAIRITHEAQMHANNSFVTLTYSPESLPDSHLYPGGNLHRPDIQKFLKRLRQDLVRKHQTNIRFYLCGEYGDLSKRAHWHLIIFGWDFPDKTFHRKGKCDDTIYRSKQLESLWTLGQSEIGAVSPQSANYVARYCTKKITGEAAEGHYQGRTPEFASWSSRPIGLGKLWYEKFHKDLYPHDYCIIDGKKRQIPPYYDKLHTLAFPEIMTIIKDKRMAKAALNLAEQEDERLITKAKIRKIQLKLHTGTI